MISISIFFGFQTNIFDPPNFCRFLNQQIPGGIFCSIPCCIQIENRVLKLLFFAPNSVYISQNILIILFEKKLVLTVYFQRIYSLTTFVLVWFNICEIMYNKSESVKFTAGRVELDAYLYMHIHLYIFVLKIFKNRIFEEYDENNE
jgi:hypothetical protein